MSGEELQRVVQERIAEVAQTLDPAELGRAMGDHLIASIPEFTDTADEDFRSGIILSSASNVAAIKAALVAGAPLGAVPPPPDAIAWAHELVHRGMSLAGLLRAYRLGHELFDQTFEAATAELDLDPDVRWRVLAGASKQLFVYIDAVCTQLVDDYENEREQWLRGAAAAQADLVQEIVAGEPVEAREASATLRHDVTALQLGFVVWSDTRTRAREHTTAPATIAKLLAAELGGTRTLIVPIGEHAAWAWTTGEALVADPPPRSAALGDRAGAAIGAIHGGVDGMFRTHHEARAARRVGEIFGVRPGTILRYPAVALTALISADPQQAANFARAELGELGTDTDPMLRLRATIQVYLDERLSPSRTARRLGIHQNTVTYRVKRAEELIGRPLEDRRLELELALRLYDGLAGLQQAAAGT